MGRKTVVLDDLTRNNIGTFKKINEVSLPISFAESWYQDSLNADQIVKLAYYSELPVGAVRAKLINTAHKSQDFESFSSQKLDPKLIPNAVYIESFAVLKAYRNFGVGKELLDWVKQIAQEKYIHAIVLHAHVSNTLAISWYEHQGFVADDVVLKDYYKNQQLDTPDAVILRLEI